MQQQQQQHELRMKNASEVDFFTEYGDSNRYKILKVIGKGSYGVVCSAIDMYSGEKVAIKRIHGIFEHISDATRILREIKLLRLLRHPDIVEIKHILLPPLKRDFKDIYVVFELMEFDLHQVIKANNDLMREHHLLFLYQLLRALKYIHAANVFHRDLKPKNILANANCKLKICDFGLARVAFNDAPTTIIWTDYVATRWYRAPELCGSFFSNYTPAIDIWSIGCIFAEVLTGKPLFPGKNAIHQLDLMTDLLGTPQLDTISRVRNDKARRYLSGMKMKQPIPFEEKFPNADPLALKLLERLLAFDPKDRPTAEEALTDPYFKPMSRVDREPSCHSISKMEFEFERRNVTKEEIRELIFREILEYHPQRLKDYITGSETSYHYLSAVDQFRKQFVHLDEDVGKLCSMPLVEKQHLSLPRSTIVYPPVIPSNPSRNLASFQDKQVIGEANKKPNEAGAFLCNMQRSSLQVNSRIFGEPSVSVDNGASTINGICVETKVMRNISICPQPVDTRASSSQGKLERHAGGSAMESERHCEQKVLLSNLMPEVCIDMRAPPFSSFVGVVGSDAKETN